MNSTFSLPYTMRYLAVRVRQKLNAEQYVSFGGPNKAWLSYGEDIKSKDSFRNNLNAIVEISQQRSDPLLLMTFASHLPADYSLERFKHKQLDYAKHISPVEIWGTPTFVKTAIEAHNEVVKDVAITNPDLFFIDQAKLLSEGGGRVFNDICHFTTLGSIAYVDNIFDSVLNAPAFSRFKN